MPSAAASTSSTSTPSWPRCSTRRRSRTSRASPRRTSTRHANRSPAHSGTKANTEALGNLEQFITQFPFEGADADKLAHPAYPELEDTARFWVHNDTAVRQEIVARLKALRTRLSTDRQTAFDAAMNKLKADDKANAPLSDAVLK